MIFNTISIQISLSGIFKYDIISIKIMYISFVTHSLMIGDRFGYL